MILNTESMLEGLKGVCGFIPSSNTIQVNNVEKLRNSIITDMIETYVFTPDAELKVMLFYLIGEMAKQLRIIPASIQGLYEARGKGLCKGFTVPAINIRGMTFDMVRAVFSAAKDMNALALIFEIAKSEIDYTGQRPAEYRTSVLAAAIKEGYKGPVFIQGDHFQVNAKSYKKDAKKELEGLKTLVSEAIMANFYNIDIDSSTLVDLSQDSYREQQRLNFEIEAELIELIRSLEPKGVTVSVGGEIGEVGGVNSTSEDLIAFMEGLNGELEKKGGSLKSISKISVQTGTSHGGVVLPNGTIAKVKLDFKTLEKLSRVALEKYKMAGAVQHGASTLPDEAFDEFPRRETAEIHLATGFQNLLLDHVDFPKDLMHELLSYLDKVFAGEKKPNETLEQFYYKTRKKLFGPFKKEFWSLPNGFKGAFNKELKKRFDFLFKKLNIQDTADIVNETVKPIDIECELTDRSIEMLKNLA